MFGQVQAAMEDYEVGKQEDMSPENGPRTNTRRSMAKQQR